MTTPDTPSLSRPTDAEIAVLRHALGGLTNSLLKRWSCGHIPCDHPEAEHREVVLKTLIVGFQCSPVTAPAPSQPVPDSRPILAPMLNKEVRDAIQARRAPRPTETETAKRLSLLESVRGLARNILGYPEASLRCKGSAQCILETADELQIHFRAASAPSDNRMPGWSGLVPVRIEERDRFGVVTRNELVATPAPSGSEAADVCPACQGTKILPHPTRVDEYMACDHAASVHRYITESSGHLARRAPVIEGLVKDVLATSSPLPASGSEAPGRWVVWSNEHRAWWRPNRCGYCNELAGAGLYTEAEAKEIARESESPSRSGRKDEEARRLVDELRRADAGTVAALLLAAAPLQDGGGVGATETGRRRGCFNCGRPERHLTICSDYEPEAPSDA